MPFSLFTILDSLAVPTAPISVFTNVCNATTPSEMKGLSYQRGSEALTLGKIPKFQSQINFKSIAL